MANKSRTPKQTKERAKSRTFRVHGDLDEKIEAAAKQSGRSVGEEIEFRLERSFRDEEIREQAFEQAWVVFEKKKTRDNVRTALDNVEAALATAKALSLDAGRSDNENPNGDALKDITQHTPDKQEKL